MIFEPFEAYLSQFSILFDQPFHPLWNLEFKKAKLKCGSYIYMQQ